MNQLNDSQADIREDLNLGLFLTKSNHMALSKCLKNALYQTLFECFYDALKLLPLTVLQGGKTRTRTLLIIKFSYFGNVNIIVIWILFRLIKYAGVFLLSI